jgi:RimJ/RimL family protein N-acetyltransferase
MTCALRPSRQADAVEMARWFADQAEPAQWGSAETRFPLAAEQIVQGNRGRRHPRYTAVDADYTPIEHVEFVHDPVNDVVRIGRFGVAPQRRRSGVGPALVTEAVALAFDEPGAHRVGLNVLADNQDARRLHQHAGFVEEGTAREAMRIGDARRSLVGLSVLRRGWEARRRAGLAVA